MDKYENVSFLDKISDKNNVENFIDNNDEACTVENYSSENDDEILTNRKNIDIAENLTIWSLKHNLSQSSLNDLLNILRNYGLKLPKDSLRLLSTPKICNIIEMGQGQFWYNGVANCVNIAISTIENPPSLSLVFNVDGLPLFRSSPLEFWPILMKIDEMLEIQPMAVAIYYGDTKPPSQEFFKQFVEEVNHLLKSGLIIDGQKINCNIKYFVCDTPARNFIKGVYVLYTFYIGTHI